MYIYIYIYIYIYKNYRGTDSCAREMAWQVVVGCRTFLYAMSRLLITGPPGPSRKGHSGVCCWFCTLYSVCRDGLSSMEFSKTSLDSGQSHLRLTIGSFSIESLKKSIDSRQSYLRLGVFFAIGVLKKPTGCFGVFKNDTNRLVLLVSNFCMYQAGVLQVKWPDWIRLLMSDMVRPARVFKNPKFSSQSFIS